MSAQAVLILGTSPKSAKSVLTMALCRALANRHLRVSPFKAMSVVQDGKETGPLLAQGLAHQCRAARLPFATPMNPVVLQTREPLQGDLWIKGERVGSARLLNEDSVLTSDLSAEIMMSICETVREAYDALVGSFDFLVIEGAGSPVDLPAEDDVPNILVARLAEAPILFSCKFSRGGGAASLIGSISCLPGDVRSRVRGFTFSDVQDETTIRHSVALVERTTAIPYLGTVPRVPLWTDTVDTYELLADTIARTLDWNAIGLAGWPLGLK